MLFVFGIFSSCVPESSFKPKINVSVIGSPTYEPGETVQYSVILSTPNKELKTLTVRGTGSRQPASSSGVYQTSPSDKWDSDRNEFTNNTVSVTVTYDVVINSDMDKGDVMELEFTVTDDIDSETDNATITVGGGDSEPTGTKLTDETTGAKVYNFKNPSSSYPSGWDMVNDVAASYSTSKNNIDVYNYSSTDDSDWDYTYGFTPALWTMHGTMLVKTSSLSYDTATLEDVISAYDSGSKLDYTKTSAGNIYVTKIRGGSTYAIIKITYIDNVSKSPQDDNIQFSYKKGSK